MLLPGTPSLGEQHHLPTGIYLETRRGPEKLCVTSVQGRRSWRGNSSLLCNLGFKSKIHDLTGKIRSQKRVFSFWHYKYSLPMNWKLELNKETLALKNLYYHRKEKYCHWKKSYWKKQNKKKQGSNMKILQRPYVPPLHTITVTENQNGNCHWQNIATLKTLETCASFFIKSYIVFIPVYYLFKWKAF